MAPITVTRAEDPERIGLGDVLEMVRRISRGNLDADMPLLDSGLDSLSAVELRNQLQRSVGNGITLPSTLVFEHPTARQIAAHISSTFSGW
eukprot:scaffold46496_cov461-Isochrysis_galbana.AAC.1